MDGVSTDCMKPADVNDAVWGQSNSTEIFFIFTPKIGDMIHFDDHIFQMGWFNHQLEEVFCFLETFDTCKNSCWIHINILRFSITLHFPYSFDIWVLQCDFHQMKTLVTSDCREGLFPEKSPMNVEHQTQTTVTLDCEVGDSAQKVKS